MKSEPVVKERIQTRWIGNTVVSIDYESDSPVPLHRLYQNRPEVFKQGLTKTTEGFVPEKYFEWNNKQTQMISSITNLDLKDWIYS